MVSDRSTHPTALDFEQTGVRDPAGCTLRQRPANAREHHLRPTSAPGHAPMSADAGRRPPPLHAPEVGAPPDVLVPAKQPRHGELEEPEGGADGRRDNYGDEAQPEAEPVERRRCGQRRAWPRPHGQLGGARRSQGPCSLSACNATGLARRRDMFSVRGGKFSSPRTTFFQKGARFSGRVRGTRCRPPTRRRLRWP